MGWWQLVHDGESRFTQERFTVMANMESENKKLARRGQITTMGYHRVPLLPPPEVEDGRVDSLTQQTQLATSRREEMRSAAEHNSIRR